MSTSLLYHAFGIRKGFKYCRTLFQKGSVIFVVKPDEQYLRCPSCRSRNITKKGVVWRMIRTIPIGIMPAYIKLAVQRIRCLCCGIVRQIKIPFVRKYRRCSRALERLVLILSKYMTIKDVAIFLKLSWDIVKDIQKEYLKKRFAKPKIRKLRQIAIDEIYLGKHSDPQYLTIVYDLQKGNVVFVGNGKGADALKPFWQRVKRAKANIEAVATDMSPAYISAVTKHLPGAALVFDRFHIVKLFNEKLTDIRRKLFHQLTEKEHKKILKGTRWLLLKNPENLDPKKDESKRLQEALAINAPLATAYYLKEDLRQLWSQPNKEQAATFLESWLQRAWSSGIRPIISIANTLGSRRSSILAWYDYHISTGPLEGLNNKIKTMKRQAYGFRDLEFFELKIKAIHQSRYALVG